MFAQIELLFDPFVDLIDFPGNVLFFFGHIPANNLRFFFKFERLDF